MKKFKIMVCLWDAGYTEMYEHEYDGIEYDEKTIKGALFDAKVSECDNELLECIYAKEVEETETWNGMHAQITAPKGTFEKIFNDAEEDETDI